jgi:hypothetical protein
VFGKLNSPDTVRIALLSFLLFSADVFATGLMSCESEPREAWQSKEDLRAWLNDDGWQVRKIKVDGGCYEVYGTTPDGQRVEAYFHPISFEKLLVTRRGEILFRKSD